MRINALFWLSSLVCCQVWVGAGGWRRSEGRAWNRLGLSQGRGHCVSTASSGLRFAGGFLKSGDKTGQSRRPATLRPLPVRTMVERADSNLGLDGWSITIATGNRYAVVRSC
jgi:hypothetical protein